MKASTTLGMAAVGILLVMGFVFLFSGVASPVEPPTVDWQQRALEAEARLVILETRRQVALEQGQACVDRLGTLVATGRRGLEKAALKALRDYEKRKAELEAKALEPKPKPKEEPKDDTKEDTDPGS